MMKFQKIKFGRITDTYRISHSYLDFGSGICPDREGCRPKCKPIERGPRALVGKYQVRYKKKLDYNVFMSYAQTKGIDSKNKNKLEMYFRNQYIKMCLSKMLKRRKTGVLNSRVRQSPDDYRDRNV